MDQVSPLDNTYVFSSHRAFFISAVPYFPRFGVTLIGVVLAAVWVEPPLRPLPALMPSLPYRLYGGKPSGFRSTPFPFWAQLPAA